MSNRKEIDESIRQWNQRKAGDRFPRDYATSQDRVPRAERRVERCNDLRICAALFGICGSVVGWVAHMLYAGGC